MKLTSGLVGALFVLGTAVSTASAAPIAYFDTVFDTDYQAFGYAGMRDVGSGSVTVSGVTGTVTRAVLTWHGPTDSTDPGANATVDFAGTSITGTNIGFSEDNNWGFLNSQAYSADVTGLVTGDGVYTLADFVKTDVNVNGVSLEVFYDDGDDTNNRDIVMFHGNDSNLASAFDPDGWQASLSGINYSGGPASLTMGVSDGQNFGNDEALYLNGALFVAAGPTWQGDTLPAGPGGPPNGKLWDLRTFDISGFLNLGLNNLFLTSDPVLSDALSLVHLSFDLPAGAAPPPPPPGVPEPGILLLLATGLAAGARRRWRQSRGSTPANLV